MSDICPGCRAPIKLVPAGISKTTGKPYQSFLACSQRCGYRLQATPNQQKALNPRGNDMERIMSAIVVLNDNLKVAIKEIRAMAQMFGEKQKDDVDVKRLDL